MKIRPLSDNVVIKMTEAEEKTVGGIILTGTAKEKPEVAEVVAVGPKAEDVKVGDKVLAKSYAGKEVKFDGETFTILEEEDILAIVE